MLSYTPDALLSVRAPEPLSCSVPLMPAGAPLDGVPRVPLWSYVPPDAPLVVPAPWVAPVPEVVPVPLMPEAPPTLPPTLLPEVLLVVVLLVVVPEVLPDMLSEEVPDVVPEVVFEVEPDRALPGVVTP